MIGGNSTLIYHCFLWLLCICPKRCLTKHQTCWELPSLAWSNDTPTQTSQVHKLGGVVRFCIKNFCAGRYIYILHSQSWKGTRSLRRRQKFTVAEHDCYLQISTQKETFSSCFGSLQNFSLNWLKAYILYINDVILWGRVFYKSSAVCFPF